MKWFYTVIGLIVALFIVFFVLFFTTPGNSLVATIAEKKIGSTLGQEVNFEEFSLDTDSFSFTLFLDDANKIKAYGTYSLFKQSILADYRIRFGDLEKLQPLTQTPLHGELRVDGKIYGDLAQLSVTGLSDLARGKTTFALVLDDLEPASFKADAEQVKIKELLAMGGLKPFADATFSLNADFSDLHPETLSGDARIEMTQGRINKKVMTEGFNITLPETTFTLTAKSQMREGKAAYSAEAASNLLRLVSKGNITPSTLETDATYDIDIQELGLLRPLANAPLRGTFSTNGTVKGDRQRLQILGKSDLAGSDTTYSVRLKELSPENITATVSHGRLEKLLYMTGEPVYAKAGIDAEIKLDNLDPEALDGRVKLSVSEGRMDRAVMKESFAISLPETTFGTTLKAVLKGENIDYTLHLLSNLAKVDSEGSIQPKTSGADLNYDVSIGELALFKPLTNAPLRGPFSTQGSVKGDRSVMTVEGSSDIAQSKSDYRLTLKELQPQSLVATVAGAKLQKLLYLAGEPSFASGNVDLDLQLHELDPKNLEGNAKLRLSKGAFNTKVLKNAYHVDLPKSAFNASLDAELDGKSIDYATTFNATLAKLSSEGSIVPQTMGLDLEYDLAVKKLELLKPLTKIEMRGPLNVSGTAKGDRNRLTLVGKSNIAKSETTFNAVLEEFAPRSFNAGIRHLQVPAFLKMMAQPHFAEGVLEADFDIPDARVGKLKGKVTTLLSNGKLDGKTVGKRLDLKGVPNATFKVKSTTQLAKETVDTEVDLTSSLATLKSRHAKMNLDSRIVTADFNVNVPDLERFYFLTERHMKGGMKITGDLKQAKHFDLKAHSDTLGGRVDAKLHDDQLHATFAKIQSLEALKMLLYPEVFRSYADGTLDYNLKSKKGVLDARLSEGRFTRNTMFDLLKSLAKTDLYKEQFKGTFKGRINDKLSDSDLFLRSNNSSISGKHIKLNSETRQIDASLHVIANNNPIDVRLRGSVNAPKVDIDASKLIKREAEKAIQKEAEKQINRLLKDLF
jgi:hypothetical protein